MSDHPPAKPKGGFLKWALWGAALVGVAGVVYIMGKASTNPEPVVHTPKTAVAANASPAFKLEHPADGTPPPAYRINDAAGKPLTLADLKGKVVVMNVWATWCAPCKIEMPLLAKLQAAYADKPVAVVAVSLDNAEALAEAKAFIAKNAPLAFYNDPDAKLPWELKPSASGVPTTVIYGKDGLERGRVSGEADWSGAAAKAVIDKTLSEG